jgi:hypothetical protein
MFKWVKGRQGSGYDKMLLSTLPWPIPFDCYLLRFPEGSEIAPHKDPVTKGKHFRLNIILKKSLSGGQFLCENPILQTSRMNLFRPDISEHSVTKVVGGSRYVFSIGWLW